jgi:putative flippase GtrA
MTIRPIDRKKTNLAWRRPIKKHRNIAKNKNTQKNTKKNARSQAIQKASLYAQDQVITSKEGPLITSSVHESPTFISSFGKAQVASLAATVFDYGTLFLLAEVFHVWYVIATAAGAFAGAISNFIINRHWSFNAAHQQWGPQAFRYTLASIGSLLLNTGGVYLVTEYCHIHYAFSVIVVSLLVGFLYNYPLYKFFVYKT